MKRAPERRSKQFGIVVALVVLATALGAVFIFSLSPRSSISNTEKASRAYRRGLMATDSEFVAYADKINSICDDVESSDIWFCYEGVGAASMKRFGTLDGTGVLKWQSQFPTPNSFNLLGLGIALSSVDIFHTEIWSIAKNKYSEAERAAIVDGWGFGQTVFVGAEDVEAVRRCQALNAEVERQSCLFGIGRSLLFSQRTASFGRLVSTAGLSERESQILLLGFGFALGFAERLTSFDASSLRDAFTAEQGRMVQSGIRLGGLTRAVLEEREPDIRADESSTAECIRKNGMASVCLRFY